jgi:hypothetical protein
MNEPNTKNRGFLGAFRKGAQARKDAKPRRSPYPDHRGGKYGNIITYSRAFIKYWQDGWDAMDKEIQDGLG